MDAVVSHGINVFIFDWYWYENQPFLENSLNDGFLKARNNSKIQFYLMWANHNASTLWDLERSHQYETIWHVSPNTMDFLVRPLFNASHLL